MNESKKNSIKRTVQGRTSSLDSEVKQDLAKIFDNAMNTVDDYEDEDVSGGQIRRSASNWSEKINYALDELPNNHPLRKNNKIQKLVNKLDSIVKKPDSEVTYDVMVAGGKPPSVSKQRFWGPIAKLIADAQVDVIKPIPESEIDHYVEPKPTYANQRQANLTKDKPKVSNIPDKPKYGTIKPGKEERAVIEGKTPGDLSKQQLLESGAKPGYFTSQVITLAAGATRYATDGVQNYKALTNSIEEAIVAADRNKTEIQQTIASIKATMADIRNKQVKNKKKKPTEYNIDGREIMTINNLYQNLSELLQPIINNLDEASNIYNDLPPSYRPGNDLPSGWNVELIISYRNAEEIDHNFSMLDGSDIQKDIVAVSQDQSLISKIEVFLKDIYDGHVLEKIREDLGDRQYHYVRLGQAYSDLIAIDKNKDVYNEFMKLLGDKKDSKSIRQAIQQYVVNQVSKYA